MRELTFKQWLESGIAWTENVQATFNFHRSVYASFLQHTSLMPTNGSKLLLCLIIVRRMMLFIPL